MPNLSLLVTEAAELTWLHDGDWTFPLHNSTFRINCSADVKSGFSSPFYLKAVEKIS